jgi:hypothetical protein
MEKKVKKLTFFIPRILGILFIIFLMLFSLDVFEAGVPFFHTLLALFIHNIPALVLFGLLIISWKHEIIGGVLFILAGLLLTLALGWGIIITGSAFLIGILFIIDGAIKHK